MATPTPSHPSTPDHPPANPDTAALRVLADVLQTRHQADAVSATADDPDHLAKLEGASVQFHFRAGIALRLIAAGLRSEPAAATPPPR